MSGFLIENGVLLNYVGSERGDGEPFDKFKL